MKRIPYTASLLFALLFSGLLQANPEKRNFIGISYLDKVSIVANKENLLFGASSIRYDEAKKRFIILCAGTDAYTEISGDAALSRYETFDIPRYYTFDLSDIWSEEQQALRENLSGKQLTLSRHYINPGDNLKSIFNGGVNLESVAPLGGDELLVVSDGGTGERGAYSSLLRVNEDGRVTGNYRFPDQYTNDESWIHYLTGGGKGIKPNGGIKSLDRISGTNEYIAVVEDPLVQDERNWDKDWGSVPARLLHFSMDEFVSSNNENGTLQLLGEYFYPSPEYVTDVAYLFKTSALAVESTKGTLFGKPVYYTDINFFSYGRAPNLSDIDENDYPQAIGNARQRTAVKTGAVYFHELQNWIPGIEHMNIQGISMGPEFADGSRLMVLISKSDAYKLPEIMLRDLTSKSSVVPAWLWKLVKQFITPTSREMLTSWERPVTHILFFKIAPRLLDGPVETDLEFLGVEPVRGSSPEYGGVE